MSHDTTAVDLFCGGGGTSTGYLQACEAAGLHPRLLAINHDEEAIATHSLNHPHVHHLHEDLAAIDPRIAVRQYLGIRDNRLDVLLASPECQSHAYSRGGRPISEQSRATAYHPLNWLGQLYVRGAIIENVAAMKEWGPVNARNRPIKSRKGELYRAWIAMLRATGGRVEERELNAADYGAATSRRRLFITVTKQDRPFPWPEPTHAKGGISYRTADGRAVQLKPWRGAREVLDLDDLGPSIFNRKAHKLKPLAPKTLERIFMGLERFGGPLLQPVVAVLRAHATGSPIDAPLPTPAAQGQHLGIVNPLLVKIDNGSSGRAHPSTDPLTTLVGKENLGVAQPVIVHVAHGTKGERNGRTHSADQPLPTLTYENGLGVARYVLQVNHGDNKPGSGRGNGGRVRPDSMPLPVVTKEGGLGVADVRFLTPHRVFDEFRVDPIDQPLRTLDHASDDIGLCQAVVTDGKTTHPLSGQFIVPNFGERPTQAPRTHALEDPLPAPTSHGAGCLATWQFLVKFYGTAVAQKLVDPLGTLTGNDRFGLVTPYGVELADGLYLDIRFRMLKVRELARGMGFPEGYRFSGTKKDKVRMIGNAVEVNQAQALTGALLGMLFARKAVHA